MRFVLWPVENKRECPGTCRRIGRSAVINSVQVYVRPIHETYIHIMSDSQYIDRKTAARSYRPSGHVRLDLELFIFMAH